MRRAPLVLGATALGLAATLGFHPRAPTSITTATANPRGTASSGTTAAAPGGARAGSAASSASKPSSSSAATTVTGAAASTPYGPAQVRVTIRNGKITDITAVQLPSNDPHSQQIAVAVEPMLRASALAAQSANINAISGATYTSEGYKSSLQSALDQAGFATASPSA